MSERRRRSLGSVALSVLVVAVLLASLFVVHPSTGVPSAATTSMAPLLNNTVETPPASWSTAPRATVPDQEPGLHVAGARDLGPATRGRLLIVVTFALQEPSELNEFLSQLSSPASPLYHHYLTASQFDQRYGGSSRPYSAATGFFDSFGVSDLQTSADHLTLTFEASPSQVASIFHTTIDSFEVAGLRYLAPTSSPTLPQPLASTILSVEGLSTYSAYLYHTNSQASVLHADSPARGAEVRTSAGYLPPAEVNGVQYEYAPDFQVGYDELGLFQDSGYPTNAVVATILWSGSNVDGTPVAPFDPSDVYAFYNETLPAGEPHSSVSGVPLDGAPAPGPSAGTDVTGANVENTLDLEMVGSTAPGASIYNVYGPDASQADLDSALSYILNPTNTPGLANVTVITNSWGGTDGNDSTWFQDLQEAQSRGISVLASTGDSGNDPSSSKWVGSDVEFPSSAAWDDFGVTAVGGTTVSMNSGLGLLSQVVWSISARDTEIGGPAGSSGGISSVFPEPSWQLDTSANGPIAGEGRGVPDIGAIANNTLITLTVSGTQYRASNATYGGAFEWAWGTSIATPLEAGVVAEIDHVLANHDNPTLGFLNPQLYTLANGEYGPLTSTATTGYYPTGSYASPLPTLPLLDVVEGSNFEYSALVGYDLVTGWGSLDAYNYTMYFLSVPSQGVYGRLSGIEDDLSLTALSVTSYEPDHSVNTAYNASIQQNFFVANSLGAPIYWVQNVIYINNTSAGWVMNYTGWVIYPFYGLYSSESVYEYNFPAGQVVSFPNTFDVKSVLRANAGFNAQYIAFSVGADTITLPVPGGAYIIGSLAYQYSWRGANFTNGPFPDNPDVGGLAPQFGLVGGPSLGQGEFASPTAGSLAVSVEPFGSSSFIPANTQTFGDNVDQTGETALNLAWTATSLSDWTLGISGGSETQGVLAYQPGYAVTFAQSGLPAGTSWSVTFNGTTTTTSSSTISFTVVNGTYAYSIGDVGGWHQTTLPYAGSVDVNGSGVTEPTILFSIMTYAVTFSETGMPTSAGGGVDFNDTGLTAFGLGGNVTFSSIPNGTYSYVVVNATGYRLLSTSPGSPLVVDASNPTVLVTFQALYTVSFTESGIPDRLNWSVSLNGNTSGVIPGSQTTAQFLIGNGSFSYVWSDTPGYHITTGTYSGTVFVVGTNPATVTVAFTPEVYTVTFVEVGMPAGDGGGVNFNGTGVVPFGPGGTVSFTGEPNGSYPYVVVAATDYRLLNSIPASPLSISGSGVTVSVTFQALYTATFGESGIPDNLSWSVSLNGNSSGAIPGSSSTTNFLVGNGTFSYAWANTPGFHITSGTYTGTVEISGMAPAEVTVVFSAVLFEARFVETGLPASLGGGVNLTGVGFASFGPGGIALFSNLSNGTYPFAVSAVGGYEFVSATPNSPLHINGANVSVLLIFAQIFEVTFSETGMPTAAGGGVSFDHGVNVGFPSGGVLVFANLTNGSYAFTITPGTGYLLVSATPSSPLTVSGSSLTVTVHFAKVYSVLFSETGMPTDAGGGVSLNGSEVASFAPGGAVSFDAINGTYPFIADAGAGYQFVSADPSGSVTVAGGNASASITFQAIYTVTFHQSGIPNGTNWMLEVSTSSPGVVAGGHSLAGTSWFTNSTGPTAALTLPNGTFSYVITASGYPTTTGTFSVAGQAQPVPVTISTPGPSGLLWWEWVVIAAVIAAAAGVGTWVVVRRRKAHAAATSAVPGGETATAVAEVGPSMGASPAGAAPAAAPGPGPSPAAGVVAPPPSAASALSPPVYNPSVLLVACPRCGRPAVYVGQYRRYYCLTCRKYA